VEIRDFTESEIGIGLVASNAGTLLLPEVLGETAARELLLGGEERDAAWAREHGFATEMVPPDKLAARIEHWTEVFSEAREPRWRQPSQC
jgi:enoyl-CoA hydratase/carnithine racemase